MSLMYFGGPLLQQEKKRYVRKTLAGDWHSRTLVGVFLRIFTLSCEISQRHAAQILQNYFCKIWVVSCHLSKFDWFSLKIH